MPLLELLGRGVPLYGLLGVLGACLGLVCALVRCPSFGLSRDDCAYLYVFGAIGAVAGAKLLYLLPRLPQLAAGLPLLWGSPPPFPPTHRAHPPTKKRILAMSFCEPRSWEL